MDFAKRVERKCIAMQIIGGAFAMRLDVEISSWESSLHHWFTCNREWRCILLITILVIIKVTIIFHHHPILLYELEPKNFTLETPPTWEKSLPHKKWQTNRNGVPSQRQRATFQIFLVLFFILFLEVIFHSIHPWTRRRQPPLCPLGQLPLLYSPLQHLEEEEGEQMRKGEEDNEDWGNIFKLKQKSIGTSC